MKFAFIIYDDMTLLDFSGVYDPITRLKNMGFIENFEYDVCALKSQVKTFEGLEIIPNQINNDLSGYDYIFIPGGNGVINLMKDPEFLAWFKNGCKNAVIAAVCGGSLVLGALGLLKDKKATTHPMLKQYLARFTENIPDSRIVTEGNIITARGVTSAIDLGLYLCEKIAGTEVKNTIQKQMDYINYTLE
jgi:cyclohexyl-isocyanide hydratase